MNQAKGNRAVVSLEEYRQAKHGNERPSVSIWLGEDQRVELDLKGIDSENAYQAAVGCYAAMGEMLKMLREKD